MTANSIFGTLGPTNYVILRNLVGSEACAHENTLYAAGVAWARSTLYQLPVGFSMGAHTNGRFSGSLLPWDAMRAFETPIPDPDGSPIVALRSTPWGLLVCKTDSLYTVTGQYPNMSVRKVADIGIVDQRAVVSVDDVVVLAGMEGIFSWRGGEFTQLSAGRQGEWQAKIRAYSRCVVGVVRDHVFVSFDATPGRRGANSRVLG